LDEFITLGVKDNTPEPSVCKTELAAPSAVGIVNSGVPEFLAILSTLILLAILLFISFYYL
jgi:hypothetical protein